jgi:hypothetical protein
VTNRTVVALYDHFSDARDAVAASIEAGASPDRVTLLANSAAGDHPTLVTNPSFAREEYAENSEKQPGALTGAEFGIGIGGTAGVALAATELMIPGIGPLAAIGTLAVAALAAAGGGIVGGIIGALTSHGVSNKDAHLYAEGVRRGATLAAIVVDESQVEQITRIAKTHNAVDIGKRSDHWIAEGWVSFDLNAHPLTAEEVQAIREREDAAGHEAEHHHVIRHYFHPGTPGHFQGGGASNEMTHYAEDRTRS